MSEERLNPEESAVEAALASLMPAQVDWDRDEMMYAAGFQAARQRTRIAQRCWMASTAGLMLICVTLSVNTWLRPVRPSSNEIVDSPRRTEDRDMPRRDSNPRQVVANDDALVLQPSIAENQYLRLQRQVLRNGIEALPEFGSAGGGVESPPSVNARALLNELLGS